MRRNLTLMTLSETAKMLGLSPRQVHRYASKGSIRRDVDPMTGRVGYDAQSVTKMRDALRIVRGRRHAAVAS